MKANLKATTCESCGAVLSKDYPYDLCPACWQDKYHSPPGYNHYHIAEVP